MKIYIANIVLFVLMAVTFKITVHSLPVCDCYDLYIQTGINHHHTSDECELPDYSHREKNSGFVQYILHTLLNFPMCRQFVLSLDKTIWQPPPFLMNYM